MSNETDEQFKKLMQDHEQLIFLYGLIEGIKHPPPDQHKTQTLQQIELRALALEQVLRKNSKQLINEITNPKNLIKYANFN